MFDDTITIFNRRSTREGDIWHPHLWYPHVLHEVEFENDKASIMGRFGTESTDNAMIIINCQNIQGEIKVEGIPYLPPKEYARLDEGSAAAYITFNDNAQYFDFLIKGDYGDTSTIKDSDYKGNFYTYMNKEYDYCYCITGVAGPYKLIPHFRLLAK